MCNLLKDKYWQPQNSLTKMFSKKVEKTSKFLLGKTAYLGEKKMC